MTTSNSFITAEHSKRTTIYRSDAGAQELLEGMNAALENAENYEPSGVMRPNLFVFGLPRSGTTLFYQVAARSFDIGYINNLSARFWGAPLIGVAFAQSLLGDRRDDSFRSDYGKSVELSGPHEFSYFWQRWLKMTNIEAVCRFGMPDDGVDWAGLAKIIGCLHDRFGTGMVHKTNFVANLTPGFAKHLQMPLFIYIDRDCADVALSILGARQKYYGNFDTWWATHPPSYEEIKGLPFPIQIARQVKDLREVYEKSMASVPQDMVLRFSYSELCEDPRAVLYTIQQRVSARYGAVLSILDGVPERFDIQRQVVSHSAEQQAVLTALRELGLAA